MSIALLDIEGTVCPITFVKETLFPYFLREFPSYLEQVNFPIHPENDLTTVLLGFPQEHRRSAENLTEHIHSLVAADTKEPALKGFQGIVWKLGYDKGDLKAPVYADAIEYLHRKEKIYIYSSGSIAAQKLLFSHVDVDGKLEDLTDKLAGYFDITTSGFKQESGSYKKILAAIGCEPSLVVFYSDNVNEVKAALEAGMKSKVVIRPGNAPLSEDDKAYDSILTFANE